MVELFKYLWQHIDTIIQGVSPIIAARIPPRQRKERQNRRAERKQYKEEQARRGRAEHHIHQYARSVAGNHHIAQIHIIGMNHPLRLEDIYVQLRVHPGSTLKYTLDPKLREAEDTHDPNILLQAAQKSLEERMDGAIEPDEAIRRYKRCVIVGNPGAGKTTLLRYLAIKSAKNELADLPSIPIYVQLNTFNPTAHENLFDLILAQVSNHHSPDIQTIHELVQEKMRGGQVLLLLDGLDETKIGMDDADIENSYITMVDAIKKLAAIYPQMPVVVTVRKAGYQNRPKLQGFDELEVVDFRAEDSKTFVIKWFAASQTTSKEEKIKDFNARLERSLRIQSLVSNPLLLSLAAIVYEGQLELPEQRADFYRQCVDVLQKKWDASRDIKRRREFPLLFQPQLLQEIAWHFHNEGKRYFPIEELLQIISKFLPSIDIPENQSRNVLEQIDIENGLLREQAHGWYGFSHLTFQEYFATQYIIANNRQEDLLKHLNNPWWEEVLLLYVGSVNDASPLLAFLLARDQEASLQNDLFHSHLILAGRCLAEKPRILNKSLREEVIKRLLEILKTTAYALIREQAANTLAMIGGAQINSQLLTLLSNQSESLLPIRESIAWALGASGEHRLARELAELLARKETGRYIRIIIARSLGILGEQSIAPILLRLLSDGQEDIYVRQSIALTLGNLDDPGFADALAQQLDSVENPLVQQSMTVALGMLDNPSVVPKLQKALANENLDWHVRGSCAKALGMLEITDSIPQMLELLTNNDDNSYVRKRVATVLGTFGADAIPVDRLLALLSDSGINASVRSSIAEALGTTGQNTIVSSLLTFLTDEQCDSSVRISITIALGKLGERDQQVIDALNSLHTAGQVDINLLGSITAASGMLGERSTVQELLQLIERPEVSQDILLHIIHALGSLGEHDNVDKQEIACKLVDILRSERIDRYRGQQIVRLLSALEEPAIVPDLITLLAQSAIDRDIRQSIADALAQLAYDKQSLTELTVLLQTTDLPDDVFRAIWTVSRRMKSGEIV
jgi:HEAT repeat protein